MPGVAAVEQDRLRQLGPSRRQGGPAAAGPPNDTAAFIGADKVWPSLGGQDQAAGRHRRRHRHRHLARAPDARGPGPPDARPAAPLRLRVRRRRRRRAARRSPATTSWSAPTRSSDTYLDRSPPSPASTATRGRVLGPRRRRATAPTPPPPRPAARSPARRSSASTAARSAASPPAHRSSPTGSASPGLLLVRLGRRRRAGDPRRRRRHQLLDQRRRQPYTDPVELAFLDAYAAGISVNASAGNDGPGAGTADHAGPWVTTVGASTSEPRVRSRRSTLTAPDGDDLLARRARPSRRASPRTGRARRRACRLHGRAAAATPVRRRARSTGKVVVCQRGTQRPGREGLQRPAGRRGRDDPVQPDGLRHRDRQPLPAGDPPRRARTTTCSPSSRPTRTSTAPGPPGRSADARAT